MHPEKYSLTWHTYSDHLKSMMKELMINEDFSDVTLVTEDKKHIKAHINILSTCIPVFKDLLRKENNSNQIIYLRGIQFSEIQSIIQFIYLGEVSLSEERLDEFIAVAESLEIKELLNAVPEMNVTPDDKASPSDPETPTAKMEEKTIKIKILELLKEQNFSFDHTTKQDRDTKLTCDQCEYQATRKECLTVHIQSKHDGVKYPCGQCEYQATHPSNLTRHVRSIHDGMKYTCNQCEYQATHYRSLKEHKQSVHDGLKFICNHCGYQAAKKSILNVHIQNKHEGVKFACDQCDYMATQKNNLSTHIKNMH